MLRRTFGRGVLPEQASALLTNPVRSILQFSPRRLAERLSLSRDDRVLELGPGPGFFSVDFARRLTNGQLVLIDLQDGMLRRARARLGRAGAANASLLQGNAARLPCRDGAFDVAFLVAVLGEVTDPEACVSGLARVIRPRGTLSISEQWSDPDFQSIERVGSLIEATRCFEPAVRHGRRRNYTANFRRLDTTPSFGESSSGSQSAPAGP